MYSINKKIWQKGANYDIKRKIAFDYINNQIRDILTAINRNEGNHVEYDIDENCYFITFSNDTIIKIKIEPV